MFRRFLDAADYWLGYSDDSSAGSYDPARECCVVIANNPANAADVPGAGDGEVPPALGLDRAWPRGQAPLRPQRRGGPTSTRSWPRLASSRPSWRKSTAQCGCFAPPSRGKPPGAANARANWAGKPVTASTPTSTSTTRIRPHERAKSSLPPRRCCGPYPPLRHPRRGTCTARRRHSSSKRPSSRPRARRPTSVSRGAHGTMGRARSRALGPRRWRGRVPRQPGAHVGQGTAPRHARASARRRRPQRHQRPTNEQGGGTGGSRLPPSTGWTLR
jgi:hypothetical protein